VYPGKLEESKPAVGMALNKAAQIVMHRVWPEGFGPGNAPVPAAALEKFEEELKAYSA
jgi:hypothetical protein